MGWTTPRSWSPGDTPDDSGAFSFNTYVRDNFEAEAPYVLANVGSIPRASGSHALAEITQGEIAQALQVVSGAWKWVDLSTPALLAAKSYNPSVSGSSITGFAPFGSGTLGWPGVGATSAAAATDVDATNLAVTFTAPPSQSVRVILSASIGLNADYGDYFYWSIREGSSLLHETPGMLSGMYSVEFTLSGIGSGSHTWKWGHRASVINTGQNATLFGEFAYDLSYGTASITSGTNLVTTSAAMYPSYVGQEMSIAGAGPGGTDLNCFVTSAPTTSTYTIDRNASTTVSGAAQSFVARAYSGPAQMEVWAVP